jgi:hypothetical protein
MPTDQWLHAALAYPGVKLLELTPDIAADACSLPRSFHRDPADQIIVATATLVIETGSIHGGRVSEACLVPATRRTDRVTVAEVARIGEMHSGADAE